MTSQQLTDSSEVVYYELETLIAANRLNKAASQRLAAQPEDVLARTAKNCSVESFLVHYRNLKQFLNNQKGSDDVKASHYVPSWPDNNFAVDLDEDKRINKLLQHIDCDRKSWTPGDWERFLDPMEERICAAMEKFITSVDKSYTQFSNRMADLLAERKASVSSKYAGTVSNSTQSLKKCGDIFTEWKWNQ
jgi:hypothetical protein